MAVIGVVAALTLPSLVQSYRNREVESRLMKIYSVMNQAILMSEVDNGPKEYWPAKCTDTADCREYFNKYILKYLKNVSTVEFSSYGGYNIAIYFLDGSVLISKGGYDYFYFPHARYFDKDNFVSYGNGGGIIRNGIGITNFAFGFYPSYTERAYRFHYKKGFEPYTIQLGDETQDAAKQGMYACSKEYNGKANFCTVLIRLNGWKIPKDYPFRVK